MTKNISWFNKARLYMSNHGMVVKGILHYALPVRECCKCGAVFNNDFCPVCECGTGWRQTNCRKDECKSGNAFVFQSSTDKYEFFIFCKQCNKWEMVHGLPKKPEKYIKSLSMSGNGCNVDW